jgi:predicted nucleic acid-binding protein
MPVLFEVFKWLLFEAGPQAARKGLTKMMEGAVVVPFTLEDLEEARLLLARLPGWEGTLEDASVALLALRLKAPVWTLNYRDLGAFPALRFWTP